MWILLLDSHKNSVQQGLYLPPVYGLGNTGPESLSHSLKVTQLIMSEATFDPEHSECRAEVCHYQRLFGGWEKCPLYGCLSATVSVPHHSPHLLGQGPKAGESPEGIR